VHGLIFNWVAISLLLQTLCRQFENSRVSRGHFDFANISHMNLADRADLASSANKFPEKQLFRHLFSGEQKEIYPFECSNLAAEKDWPLQFSAKNPTHPGTNRPTMEPQNPLASVGMISADFCTDRAAATAKLQQFAAKRLRMRILQTPQKAIWTINCTIQREP
jgi:hypothetical protein